MIISLTCVGRSWLCFIDAGRRRREDGASVVCRGAGAPAVHHIHWYVCAVIVCVCQCIY